MDLVWGGFQSFRTLCNAKRQRTRLVASSYLTTTKTIANWFPASRVQAIDRWSPVVHQYLRQERVHSQNCLSLWSFFPEKLILHAILLSHPSRSMNKFGYRRRAFGSSFLANKGNKTARSTCRLCKGRHDLDNLSAKNSRRKICHLERNTHRQMDCVLAVLSLDIGQNVCKEESLSDLKEITSNTLSREFQKARRKWRKRRR